MKKETLKEIKIKLQKIKPYLNVLGERYITTSAKTRREIHILNKNTGCEFWCQLSRLYSPNYQYNIIRYTTENIKNAISNLTNGEFELVSECTKYNDIITILHKKCGNTRKIRASHFINDGIRCKFCSIKNITKTNEEFDKEIERYGNPFITRQSDYKNYHSDIVMYCSKCGKTFITKAVDLKRQFNEFGEIHCPNCKDDFYGEKFINELLSDLKINGIFKRQYSNQLCKDKRLLRFDFAILDSLNTKNLPLALIEYDGSQHFDPNSKYARNRFSDIVKKDNIKNKFCKDYNIPLLRTSTCKNSVLKEEIIKFLTINNILK